MRERDLEEGKGGIGGEGMSERGESGRNCGRREWAARRTRSCFDIGRRLVKGMYLLAEKKLQIEEEVSLFP
jgi:hypothetical protein